MGGGQRMIRTAAYWPSWQAAFVGLSPPPPPSPLAQAVAQGDGALQLVKCYL